MAYETTTPRAPRGTRPPHRRGSGGIWMALIGAAIVIAGIWLIWAWWDTDEDVTVDEQAAVDDTAELERAGIEPEQATTAPDEAKTAQVGATIEQISSDPTQYEGQRVTVTGEVEGQVADNAVRVEGNAPGAKSSLLIFDNRGRPLSVQEGEQVRVSGNVEVFELAQVERATGVDLDDDRFADYEGRPVLMATSVQKSAQARDETEDETPR